MSDSPGATVVDFWFDPACPYSWTASHWLRAVQQRRPVRVREHAMPLYLLNEHRTDVAAVYRRNIEAAGGPARVATRRGDQIFELKRTRVRTPNLHLKEEPAMTTMTPTEVEAVWTSIDDQRARTADLLQQLSPEQWDHPSLCQGWSVRHVAAHLTLQQQRIRDVAAFIARHPQLLRSLTLNASIHDSAVLQAQLLPTPQISSRIRAMIGSRKHNAFVTPLETLTDILVHSQDIAIPLGMDLPMRPTAGALAATRRWDTRRSWLSTVFDPIPLTGYRLTATDTNWTRGHGPEIAGPISALLLLLTGRNAALAQLSGAGANALRSTASRPV